MLDSYGTYNNEFRWHKLFSFLSKSVTFNEIQIQGFKQNTVYSILHKICKLSKEKLFKKLDQKL